MSDDSAFIERKEIRDSQRGFALIKETGALRALLARLRRRNRCYDDQPLAGGLPLCNGGRAARGAEHGPFVTHRSIVASGPRTLGARMLGARGWVRLLRAEPRAERPSEYWLRPVIPPGRVSYMVGGPCS